MIFELFINATTHLFINGLIKVLKGAVFTPDEGEIMNDLEILDIHNFQITIFKLLGNDRFIAKSDSYLFHDQLLNHIQISYFNAFTKIVERHIFFFNAPFSRIFLVPEPFSLNKRRSFFKSLRVYSSCCERMKIKHGIYR